MRLPLTLAYGPDLHVTVERATIPGGGNVVRTYAQMQTPFNINEKTCRRGRCFVTVYLTKVRRAGQAQARLCARCPSTRAIRIRLKMPPIDLGDYGGYVGNRTHIVPRACRYCPAGISGSSTTELRSRMGFSEGIEPSSTVPKTAVLPLD